MINTAQFYQDLTNSGVNYFTGVPDSLLKNFCAYVTSHARQQDHVIAANEGGAMGLAIGYHLATGKVPLVYMQNSGLGNIVNPLLSMADEQIYAIPMVLMIGWRGEMTADGHQLKDEPQHKKQGQITEALLQAMNIDYLILDAETPDCQKKIASLVDNAITTQRPVAVLIRKGTFTPYTMTGNTPAAEMSREQAISVVTQQIESDAFVVSTTGMPSRELFEQRELQGQGHDRDFLVVGSMGHASQIACEVAMRSTKPVYCLDGDGAFLMHMGSTAINARAPFCHLILNNGAHDSVGGQPTVALQIDIPGIALACGYQLALRVTTEAELINALAQTAGYRGQGACLIEICVAKGARADLGRPTQSCLETKRLCMEFLASKS